MFTWLPVLFIAFISLLGAACNLFYLPMGFPQFTMVSCCLFISIILADMAVLRKKLVRVEKELGREHAVLSQSRC